MSSGHRWLGANSTNAVVRSILVVGILSILLFSTLAANASAFATASQSPVHPWDGPDATYSTVTFTGNPAADFPSDALLYTNLFTPWGSSNNISGLYGTWDATNLYLGISGLLLSGNTLLFAASNGTAWGTTNLTDLSGVAGAAYWDRYIDFTQPMNYLFYVNQTGTLTAFEVTSLAGAAVTTVETVTLAASDVNAAGITTTGGALEVALSFATIYPAGFPRFANVSLYAGIFGGAGSGAVGPTIPSGQSYDVNYEGPIELTSHDRPGGYLLENTFYTLGLDPLGTGAPASGITPNYVENETFHTVTFTGSLSNDFAPGEEALVNYNTAWGSSNLLNSMYITWNESTLFLGFNASIESNNLYFFLSNNTASGLGTYAGNFTSDTGLNHPWIFSDAVNFIGEVQYNGVGSPTPVGLYKVLTPTSTSNSSVTVSNVTADLVGSAVTTNSVELAIPFTLLYQRSASWPVLGQFANISVLAAISDTTPGSNSTGPTLPAGQTLAYSGYYNTAHTSGYFDLLNTFFTENLDPYGDGVAAPQINPTYTYGHTYHSVDFTGTPTRDFVAPEIVGTGNFTGWGDDNLINATYLTWNYTTLFVGTNSTNNAGGGDNGLAIAISNDTGVGATNFSSTNVAALSRNITFGSPVDFVFLFQLPATTGTLYEVDLADTTSTYTDFTTVGTFAAGTDGQEFSIPFSVLYPNQPAVAGLDAVPIGASISTVSYIYGGAGAYIGPTIPTDQDFSSGTAYAHLDAFTNTSIDPNKDGYAEPGVVPAAPPSVVYAGNPISLNIVFNDHQPLYEAIGGSELLPWTVVHLEEYAEQALLAGLNPEVNITYSLSGSLLYQIDAIALGDYNNSYLEAASIPTTQWGNSVYTEVTTYGDTFLNSFVPSYEWNTTTVANLLEYDLAFNTPPWVYTASPPAAAVYDTLFHLYQASTALSTAQLTNALVEFFLWSTSEPIITGQLGAAYINSTMWSLFNQTSFTIGDISIIQAYYPVEAQLVLSAFSHDRMLNDGAGGNVELITTPFDHPILPLLLTNNWTDENGDAVTKGVWSNDTIAQLNIGSELYEQLFGQAPLGLWSPEQAVSAATVPYIDQAGYTWTSSSEATLAETGISVPGSGAVTAQEMENLYTPYTVTNGSSSTVMVFRDDTLSNDWGFNYGSVANTSGNWAAVGDFISYLKNVYATIPRSAHSSTLVTLALDGENWMFMSNFPEDGVPFLQDVYTALEQNSSWLSTTTVQQYLATNPTLPTISSLPTGSWNNEPTGSGIDSYLGQWAGHGLQDALWQQLTTVRSDVQAFGTANDLTQPMTLAALEAANDFPYINEWNSSTLEDKYTEAWTAIYGAEGSDIYFALDPDDQSPTAQNALVFEQEFRDDLSTALTVLGLPLTPFLESSYEPPVTPTVWGTNASVTPLLDGSLYTTQSFPGGTGYSVNHNDAWSGAYEEATGDATSGAGEIASTTYAFSVSDLYFSVAVNGATSAYKSPNFYTAATDEIDIFFSPVNPQAGDVQSLNVPDAIYTVGSTSFGFAATTEATIEGSSVIPSGSATLGVFASSASGTWTSTASVAGDAFVGGLLQLQVPMTDLGMVPGDSISFFVAAVNGTSGQAVSWSGPMSITVPSSLATLTPVAAIQNTAASNGPGDYTYPTAHYTTTSSPLDFPANSFDIEWFNVSMNPYTVQFNITFGNLSNPFGESLGFSQPIVDIFIHEPGQTGVSGFYAGPDVNIASVDAWQYVIQASGEATSNYVENAAGIENPAGLVVTSNLGEGTAANPTIVPDRTVSIQVPTSTIGTAIGSYSYVVVAGSQDGEGSLVNSWRIVDSGPATEYQGGGANFTDSPNVYSYLAPAIVGQGATLTQQDLLSNYTNTQNATLVGITLPLLTPITSTVAKLGDSAIVNVSGDPDAFYAVGSQVYNSTSVDGSVWTTPTPLVNLSFVPDGLAAVGGANPGLLAWNGSSYVFENLATDALTVGTASGTIGAASVTYADGTFLVALEVAGTVYVGPPGAAAWDSDALAAEAVGLSTDSVGTYLGYATATSVNVIELTLGTDTADFGTTSELSSAIPSGTTTALSLAAAPNGAFAVALAITNTTGSNIFLATGAGNVALKALTTDGADSSPSVLLGSSDGSYEAYVGFSNSASGGNVYFLPTPVAAVTPTSTTSPPPSSTTWEWLVVIVVVIVVVLVVVAVLMRKPKEPAPGTAPTAPSTTPSEGTGSGEAETAGSASDEAGGDAPLGGPST